MTKSIMYWLLILFVLVAGAPGLAQFSPHNNTPPPEKLAEPGPNNQTLHVDLINGRSTNTGLSRINALNSIQAAIFAAKPGDTIITWPGIYRESINTLGKAITITSGGDAAIIEGQPVAITCQTAEKGETVIRNLVIRNCGSGLLLINSSPTLIHLTLADNREGIVGYGSSGPRLINSILWNQRVDISCEKDELYYLIDADYCCFRHPNFNIKGEGNIGQNPLFADMGRGDYHLRSERGRFMPYSGTDITGQGDPNSPQSDQTRGIWVLDNVSSPCIDAGTPLARPQRERMPNGGRINMGAYGNTPYASLSEWPIAADLNRDGVADLRDAALFASQWLLELPWARTDLPPGL